MSAFNKYLNREAEKKILAQRFVNKQISLEESIHYCEKLDLTDSEIEEIFEGLGSSIKRGWKSMTGRGNEANQEYVDEIQQRDRDNVSKGPSAGQKVAGAFQARSGIKAAKTANKASAKQTAVIKKQINQLTANMQAYTKSGQADLASQAQAQITELQQQLTAVPGEQVARTGSEYAAQASAEKTAAAASQTGGKVARTLAKSLVTTISQAVSTFNKAAVVAETPQGVAEQLKILQAAIAKATQQLASGAKLPSASKAKVPQLDPGKGERVSADGDMAKRYNVTPKLKSGGELPNPLG